MRQAQNSKRVRGRGGRKVVNQMNRTMDSNGPDVKIRGTASHIYEKYQALARDANSSGDRVMAENYLQHAEHYFRLINAMQAQSSGANAQAQPGASGSAPNASQVADGPQPVVATDAPAESGDADGQPAAAEAANDAPAEKPASRGRGSGTRNPRSRRRVTSAEPASKKAAAAAEPAEGEQSEASAASA